ncbi:MAG: DUF1330 domain-containing protein [Actinomycetota bacterium]
MADMPKGYIIFTEAVHDADALEAYVGPAGATVVAAGGTALVAGSALDVVEGEWHGEVTVVLEFDTVEAATAWYHSDAYQQLAPRRQAATQSNAAIFAGFEPPPT